MLRLNPAVETEKKTTACRVMMDANPKRQNFTQKLGPKKIAIIAPGIMKASQRIQENKERAVVLRMTNIGSFLSIILVVK